MKLANGFGLALAAAVVFALAGGIVRAGAADFPFVGDGTDRSPYRISSAADWDALSALIEEGANTQRFQFKQTEDFTVSTMLGTGENPFKGVYDGGGRTLTVSIASDADYAAPFRWIHQATIRNLNVAGSVSGPDFASGLVGGIAAVEGRTSNGRIENCGVSVNVESSHGGEHAGGVVGHGGTSKTEIVGCVFSGGIAGAKYAGTLWGWSDDGARPMLEYCLDVSRSDHPIGIGGGLPDVYSVYYTNPDKGEGGERVWKDSGDHGTFVYAVTGGEDVSLACNEDVLVQFDDYRYEEVPLQYDVSGAAFHASAVLYDGILYAEAHRIVYDVTGDEHRQVNHLRLVPIVPDLEHPHLSDCYTNGAIYVEINGGTVNFYNHPTERVAENLIATGTLSGIIVTFAPVHYAGPLEPGARSLEGTFFVPTGALANDVDIAIVRRHAPVALAPSYLGPTNEYRELVGFTATAGTLAKDGETGYRLAMTNANVTINANVIDRVDLDYVNAAGEAQPSLRPSRYRLAFPDTAVLDGGWWAVSGAVTNAGRIVVAGDVNLVLMDGAELVAPRGIDVTAEDGVTNRLTIWAQSGGTGVLYAGTTNGLDGTCDLHAAAIGGRHGCENAGAITVNGGIVSAVGGTYGAGIGGGSDAGFLGGKGGTVAIKGGTVTARSDGGAAIGWGGGIGGSPASHGLLAIDGMKVADPAGILADDREDVCRAEDGASVTLVVCDPHDYDGARCKWCGAPEPPVVSNVVARQRWPWNGLVDVDYEVGGYTTGMVARLSFAASDGRSWIASNFLAGAEPSAEPGAHRATWDTAADGATNVVAGSVAATVELVRASFRRLALDFGGFGVRTDAAAYRATLYDLAGNPTKDPQTVAIGDAPPPDALFEFVPFATRKAVVEFLDGDGNVLCETAVEGDAFPGPSSDRMVVVPVREGDPVTLRVVHAWPAETETAAVRIVYDDGVEKRAFVEGAAFDAASGTCEAVFRAAGGAASVKSVTLLRNGIAFEWLDYATAPASADGALELDVDGNEFANGAYAAGTAMQVANPRHLDNVRNHPLGGSFVQVKDIDFAGSCGILNAVAIAKGAKGTTITSTRSVVDAKARFYGREVDDYGWFYGWLPIGSEASPFVGTYDGGGFRIANAVGNAVDASSNHALSGLFGVVGDENAEGAETVVTNVVLAGSCSFHSNYLSALVCKNRGRLAIRDCDSAAEHFSAQYAAGMCAEQHEEDKRGWHVSIDGCRTGGRILGKWCGGMLSYVSYGFAALSGCVFDGTMVAWENLGGMVYYCGINTDARCTIGNCTVKGTLSIPNGATTPASGGLIGELKATLALTGNNLASCEMEYSGSKKIGGVIGRSDFSEAELRAVLSGHVTVATGVVHDVSEADKIGTYCGQPWIDSL